MQCWQKTKRQRCRTHENPGDGDRKTVTDMEQLDSGQTVSGILEVMSDGFGFIRSDHYLPGDHDVYVSPAQIRRFNLKTGDIVTGNTKVKTEREKFSALLYLKEVNGWLRMRMQRDRTLRI